jgi:PAS domain S-box-containing protein
LAGGKVPPGEMSHRCRDGSIGYHTFSCQPVRVGPLVAGAEGFLIDTTPLRRAREDFRMIFERMIDGFAVHEIICDAAGKPTDYRFLAVNPAFERQTGLLAANVVGRTVRQILPVVEEKWIENYGKVALSGVPVSFVEYSAALDRHFEISAFRPAPNQFACILVDITARRAALEQIREQAALLSVTRDAIILVDLENRVRYWNRGAEGVYGWTAAEAVGANLHPLVYDETHPPPLAARDAIMLSGEWSGELRQRTKGKGTVVVRARGVLMRDEADAPRSILLTATDLTEAKRLEVLLQRAQRLESIGSLASGVAHDLNNVLSPIMMSVELLRPLAVTPQDREVLRLMSDSVRRGADVVRQLLLFGRGSDTPGSVVDVSKVVKEILRMVRETFPRNLEISGQSPADLWSVRGHATQIYQVLLNLCVNARDAMPGGGRLTLEVGNRELHEDFVRRYPEARVGRFVELAVLDSGTGIEPGIVDRIFDPFFSTKEQGKGTGLGLSTALGIVRNHNGFITVDSQLGRGSAFRVFIPAAKAEPAGEPMDPTPPLAAGRGETILLVDDEESIRQVLGRALTTLGYHPLVAASGREGMRLARDHRDQVKLAVLDMMMGGVDGLSLVTRMRELVPGLPIIACSGLERYRAELAALGLPQLHFLRKPFTTVQISETIRAVLDGHTPTGSSAPF